jgi:hypothetical protein
MGKPAPICPKPKLPYVKYTPENIELTTTQAPYNDDEDFSVIIIPTAIIFTTTTLSPTVFNVTNNGSGSYIINGSNNPTLNLIRGVTYTFIINATGHPFWIKTTQTTGQANAYNIGVINNGSTNLTLIFTIADNSPSTLYYNCEFHASMAGSINITGTTPTVTTSTTTSTTTTLNSTTTTTTVAPTTTAAPTTTTTTTTTTSSGATGTCTFEYYQDGGGGWDIIASNCGAGFTCASAPTGSGYSGETVTLPCVPV